MSVWWDGEVGVGATPNDDETGGESLGHFRPSRTSMDWSSPPSNFLGVPAKTRSSQGHSTRSRLSAISTGLSQLNSHEPVVEGTLRWSRARFDRRMYGWIVAVVVTISVVQEAARIFIVRGCNRSEAVNEESRCSLVWTYVVALPTVAKQAGVLVAALSGFISFLIRLSWFRAAMRRGKMQDGMAATDHKILAGHWTSAASRDSYAETSRLILDASVLVIFLAGVSTALVVAWQWDNAHKLRRSNPEMIAEMMSVCCRVQTDEWDAAVCSTPCKMGHGGLSTMLTATAGLFTILVASLVFIPPKLWSPVTFQAVRKTNDTQMHRLLSLPIPTAVFMVFNVLGFVLYAGSFVGMAGLDRPAVWEAALYLCVMLFCAELLVVIWVAPWTRVAESTKEALRTVGDLVCRKKRVLPGGESDMFDEEDHHPWRAAFWKCRECASYRQTVLLFCAMYCYGIEVLTENGNSAYDLWLLRVLTLLLIIFTRDKPVGFEVLHRTGAAFGLTINARQLRAAILSHLAGKRHKGKVCRYKASLFRMADTMAVSYRWSPKIVTLADGFSINMTEWQLKELVEAIDRCKCLYVWLDSCSVPQHIPSLKSILLSRMMAVYASAFVTLVLVSRECETERYHQRMWTLQEFCTCTQFILAIEEEQGDKVQDPESQSRDTVKGVEGIHAESQRAKHLAAQALIIPVWLGDSTESVVRSIPSAEANTMWKAFCVLSSKRHCLYKADSVRALYPLVWNRPSESEEELAAFCQAVEDVHGISQAEVLALLRAYSSLKLARAGPFLSRIESDVVVPSSADPPQHNSLPPPRSPQSAEAWFE